jgi:anti-sigma regulatory factor (Ser/Thr protein kinase)
MTVESEPFQGGRHQAGRHVSGPDLAALTTGTSPESERELLVLDVGCGREAPGLVRAAVSQIKELGAAREDAILVASELVTNAVVHSGGSPADTIQVRAVLIRGDVLISVHDRGLSSDAPHVRDADVSRAGGWGLGIVKRLARRWGFERDRGHRVWAELATRPGHLLAIADQKILSGDKAGGRQADGGCAPGAGAV